MAGANSDAFRACAVTHRYAWRNNPRRAELYGRQCRILVVGQRMGSVLIEMENGERVVTSRRALRRTPPQSVPQTEDDGA